MIQLVILGKQELFRTIFDYGKWPEEKERYITRGVVEKDKNPMCRDLYDSMLEHHYPVPRIPQNHYTNASIGNYVQH